MTWLKNLRLRIGSWWASQFYHIRVVCPNCEWAGFVKVTKGTPLRYAVAACPSCGVESSCRHIEPGAVMTPVPQGPGKVVWFPVSPGIRQIKCKPGLLYDPVRHDFYAPLAYADDVLLGPPSARHEAGHSLSCSVNSGSLLDGSPWHWYGHFFGDLW
jgi:hypothetical protein